jgi:hypothetical protein
MKTEQLKLGLDIHGVCDAYPKLFTKLSNLFVNSGHEVHIITGQEFSEEFFKQIKDLGINFTHFFSVTDYHRSIGTPIWYSEKGRPWLDEKLWNKTKGEYCEREGINLHFDDTKDYGAHFENCLYFHLLN